MKLDSNRRELHGFVTAGGRRTVVVYVIEQWGVDLVSSVGCGLAYLWRGSQVVAISVVGLQWLCRCCNKVNNDGFVAMG